VKADLAAFLCAGMMLRHAGRADISQSAANRLILFVCSRPASIVHSPFVQQAAL